MHVVKFLRHIELKIEKKKEREKDKQVFKM